VRCRARHASPGAARAQPAQLAREGHEHVVAAARAARPPEASGGGGDYGWQELK
jgi:hypothetical protein